MTFKDQIAKVLSDVTGISEVSVEFASNEKFGDYSSNVAMVNSKQSGNFLENIEWILKTIKKSNFSKYYDYELPVGKTLAGNITYLRGSTYAKIKGFRDKFDGHPEITKEYFWALPYVLYSPEHFIRVKKYKNRYLLVGHLTKQFAVIIEVDIEKTKNYIVSAFMVKDRYLKKREVDCINHKKIGKQSLAFFQKIGKPARTAVSSILASEINQSGGSRFSTLQDTYDIYNKLEKKSQDFSLKYDIKINPVEYAKEISDRFNKNVGKLGITAENAGGFINFKLNNDTLVSNLIHIDDEKENYGKSNLGNGKLAIVEYSSPNIAKPFGVGHLRSTVIGDAIANLMESLGYKVMRDNHLGDWGTQFGKVICAIKKWGNEEEIEKSESPVDELVRLYVKYHDESKIDPKLDDEARSWFKKLEDGDTETKRLWQKCVDWSWAEFEKIYKLLGINFDSSFNDGRGLGESFFESRMASVISELNENKLIKVGEDGAKLVFFDDEKYPPLMILKKDGTTLYSTRDLATDKYRLEKYNPEIVINEVGSEQSLYFKQVFEIEKILGWYKEGQRVHVGHGLFLLDGKKMSTRAGKTVKLDEVLTEAVERAKKLGNTEDETAKQVGIGAIKYFDLSHQPMTNINFDWDTMFSMDGNSSPYIQYTIARINSLVAKGKVAKDLKIDKIKLNDQETAVLRKLAQFQEIIVTAGKTYSPNILCNYLYDLASKFNTLYNKHKIVGSETEEFRLLLSKSTAQVLKNGLKLLGIEAPERM